MRLVNANRPERWKEDVRTSVDMFNSWFLDFAPLTFREQRQATAEQVEGMLRRTGDLIRIDATTLRECPEILPVLRQATAPPIARDRLAGLADVPRSLLTSMEREERLPPRAGDAELDEWLGRMTATIRRLLDVGIFPWLEEGVEAEERDRAIAASIVADRLCGTLADPIIRNAQERRQLTAIRRFLEARGYEEHSEPLASECTSMEPGTFAFRMTVIGLSEDGSPVNLPIDAVVMPLGSSLPCVPLMVEAKSAGDFTNTNKRRKEEATKIRQLRAAFGEQTRLILFLCGYFDCGYLGYEAAEGLDWVWEHRVEDFIELGI